MRRVAIVAALVGSVVVVARRLVPGLHARMLAGCNDMFERIPDDFPPKRMMGGIDEIRADTARILELLDEGRGQTEGTSFDEAFATGSEEGVTVHA